MRQFIIAMVQSRGWRYRRHAATTSWPSIGAQGDQLVCDADHLGPTSASRLCVTAKRFCCGGVNRLSRAAVSVFPRHRLSGSRPAGSLPARGSACSTDAAMYQHVSGRKDVFLRGRARASRGPRSSDWVRRGVGEVNRSTHGWPMRLDVGEGMQVARDGI